MKCVDCLPLLEEFFDGEVDNKTGVRVREHLAACAECAEAFDALRAEQELFLRYDRELEVSPALWHGVRTAIAAESAPEAKPRPRSFLTGLRGQIAAALALFAARPALASSMALVAVGVTAGALWYVNSVRPSVTTPARTNELAQGVGGVKPAPTTPNPTSTTDEIDLSKVTLTDVPVNGGQPEERGLGSTRRAQPVVAAAASRATTNRASVKNETTGVVSFVDAGHDTAADEEALPAVDSAALIEQDVADAVALLDPEDEAVARHVERAQVLLRSFKNTRAADGEADIAYEREVSRKLLEENISLQLDADADNNKKAKKVLSQLEPYLNDIANLRDRPARGELRSIRERMEKQEIIAALHVYDD